MQNRIQSYMALAAAALVLTGCKGQTANDGKQNAFFTNLQAAAVEYTVTSENVKLNKVEVTKDTVIKVDGKAMTIAIGDYTYSANNFAAVGTSGVQFVGLTIGNGKNEKDDFGLNNLAITLTPNVKDTKEVTFSGKDATGADFSFLAVVKAEAKK